MRTTFRTPKGTDLPIMNMRGKEYLEVKYRLVWFREDHPTWGITTTPVSLNENSALFRSEISDDAGRIIATSHKFEDRKGFADFIEKAETGSIGRALALIGYGTQFAADELDEGERIVDAPAAPTKRVEHIKDALVYTGFGKRSVESAEEAFRINFGKFKGQTMGNVPYAELVDYANYLYRGREESGKSSPQVEAFLDNYEKLATKKMGGNTSGEEEVGGRESSVGAQKDPPGPGAPRAPSRPITGLTGIVSP